MRDKIRKRKPTRNEAREAAEGLLRDLYRERPQWVEEGVGTMFQGVADRLPQLKAAWHEPAAVFDCEYVRQGFAALVMSLGAFEALRLLDLDEPKATRRWP